MSYFPFFVDLSDKEGLIVGGGAVALRKIEKLLPYGPKLTVAALEFAEEIEEMEGIRVLRRAFSPDMLEGKYFVIAAADDRELNRRISRLCGERGILVNVVDDRDECGFIFPSLVKRGRLSVGISTEGASPSGAVWVRKRLEKEIPENFDRILEFLDGKRAAVKSEIQEEKRRSRFFAELFDKCVKMGRGLTDEEFWGLLREEAGGKNGPEIGTEPGIAEDQGTVYLVGAGCGEADLITVRGLELLRTCQVLVYDDLIADGLLAEVPEMAEKIYVGKRYKKHSMSQEEISSILIDKAGKGKRVVRLKGGDPFVFGRGGEEMEALRKAGIPCLLVPGITSAIAIPGMAGIPVTCRGVSQSLHIVTARTADTEDGLPEDLDRMAELKGTLVFLMGLNQLEKIAGRLMEAGKSPETPAAVISGGNAPRPAFVRGNLRNIAERTRKEQVESPAVIVVGEVVGTDIGVHTTIV